MIKAIIFDCWGTLFYDSVQPKPFDEFAEKLGGSMGDYPFLKSLEKSLMLERCTNAEQSVKKVLKNLKIGADKNLVKELVNILTAKAPKHIKPYPDTIRNLKKLKKRYKLCLVSNAFSLSFEKLEKKYNLRNFFVVIVPSYRVGAIKPDPKILGIALKKLGSKKEEILMVGDRLEDDVRAAEKFGIKAVLMDRKGKHPDYPNRITSLEQLERFL